MPDGNGGESHPRPEHNTERTKIRHRPEEAAEAEELKTLLAAGPASGSRAGAWTFLAMLAVLGAALHFHFAGGGGATFTNRLDADMLSHAELTMAAREHDNRLEVVPTWPYRLYDSLRRDIGWYAAAAVLVAALWGLAVQARAGRGAYLVHERLADEISQLRRRVDELEKAARSNRPDDTKG